MYYVKVQGESIADLKEGLEHHLRELEGISSRSSTKVKVETNLSVASDNEDMEEVDSPYASAAPSINSEVELDSEGLPWDRRIHSSSKKTVKNGTWKIARGVSDADAEKVKAELREGMKAVSRNIEAAPAPVMSASVPTDAPVVAPVVVSTPPLPTMSQTSGHTLETFTANFPLVMSALISEGKLTQEYVNQLKQYFNVTEIWNISSEQKAVIFEQFSQSGLIQKVG